MSSVTIFCDNFLQSMKTRWDKHQQDTYNPIKCDYEKCQFRTAIFNAKFCTLHTCQNTECLNSSARDVRYCTQHACRVSDCDYPVNKITTEGNLCWRHKCDCDDCPNINLTMSPFCGYHNCNEPRCMKKIVASKGIHCHNHGN